MDTKDVATLLVKTAGLTIFGFAVIRLPAYFPPWSQTSSLGEMFAGAAVALALPIIVALLFWFFPTTLTNKMVSGEKLAEARSGLREFERLALTVLGVSIVAYGVADFIQAAALAYFVRKQHGMTPLPADLYAGIVFPIAKIAIGAGLAVGARRISKIVARLQSDG